MLWKVRHYQKQQFGSLGYAQVISYNYYYFDVFFFFFLSQAGHFLLSSMEGLLLTASGVWDLWFFGRMLRKVFLSGDGAILMWFKVVEKRRQFGLFHADKK